MGRVVLDTGVLIAGVRGRADLSALLPDDDVAIPAVVIAEYLLGVELDTDARRASVSNGYLDALLKVVPVLNYDIDTARHHATLLAYTRRAGRPRGNHDLIIAATARATDRTVITTDDRANFGELPQVGCTVIGSES